MPVLPRKIAAGVSVFAVVRTAHAIAGGILLVCLAGIAVVYQKHELLGDIGIPLAALGVMLVTCLVAAFQPTRLSLAMYLIIGGIADYLFLYAVLRHHSELLPAAIVIINRPSTALILVGTPGNRPLPAVAWGVAGFLIGGAATVLVDLQLGIPIQFDHGPGITLANYCAVFLGLSIVQRAQRRRVPDFLKMQQETRAMEVARSSDQRTVALMHDTVLNDLALIINGPDVMDDRMRDRMTQDIETLATTHLLDEAESKEIVDPSDGSLRNQMTQLISDFQWRGLNVEFTGDTGTVAHMTQGAVTAAVGALRACLENVLAHSGADSAEIVVAAESSSVTWTVNDAGKGFDPGAVPKDRLGLRSSVFARVEREGGTVKVWSSPGSGTSVLFTLPLLDDKATR